MTPIFNIKKITQLKRKYVNNMKHTRELKRNTDIVNTKYQNIR